MNGVAAQNPAKEDHIVSSWRAPATAARLEAAAYKYELRRRTLPCCSDTVTAVCTYSTRSILPAAAGIQECSPSTQNQSRRSHQPYSTLPPTHHGPLSRLGRHLRHHHHTRKQAQRQTWPSPPPVPSWNLYPLESVFTCAPSLPSSLVRVRNIPPRVFLPAPGALRVRCAGARPGTFAAVANSCPLPLSLVGHRFRGDDRFETRDGGSSSHVEPRLVRIWRWDRPAILYAYPLRRTQSPSQRRPTGQF